MGKTIGDLDKEIDLEDNTEIFLADKIENSNKQIKGQMVKVNLMEIVNKTDKVIEIVNKTLEQHKQNDQ